MGPEGQRVLTRHFGERDVNAFLRRPGTKEFSAEGADITLKTEPREPGVSPDRFGPIFASSIRNGQHQPDSDGSQPESRSGLPSDRKEMLERILRNNKRAVQYAAFALTGAGLATAIKTLGTGAFEAGQVFVERVKGFISA